MNLKTKLFKDCNWTRTQNHLVCKWTLKDLVKLAKWLSVRLRAKWLWVRVQLQSHKLQILRLLQTRSSVTFRQLQSVDSLWNAYVTWQEHTEDIFCHLPFPLIWTVQYLISLLSEVIEFCQKADIANFWLLAKEQIESLLCIKACSIRWTM